MSERSRTLASEVRMGPLPPAHPSGLAKPRVGIGGISIESSTFSPHVSGPEAFRLRSGQELLDFYDFLGPGDELLDAARWLPGLHARSLPGGVVDRDFYEETKAGILASIAESIAAGGALDGYFLDIHGAMSVQGMEDAEGDLSAAIRAALGPDTLISASMDLHGNVSRRLLGNVDLITCYRMAPHEDYMNTKERAVHHLLARLRSAQGRDPVLRRPYKAWTPVPVLLPGEKTSTRVEPAASLYARLPEIEAEDGVLDASIWIGYAWADEPRCMAYVVVTGDDAELVTARSEELAARFWEVREQFDFVGPVDSLAGALDTALAPGAARPYVISDSGDNPTAGGAGDVTWTLARLLEREDLRRRGGMLIHASIFDPAAVAQARAAGVGGTVEVLLGARVDAGPQAPLRIRAEVFSFTEGDPVAGAQAVLRVGSVHAIITERRKPFHRLADFRDLGLDPEAAEVLVVKIGYLEPELYDLAADWTMALTPGGVDQDLLRLGHRNLAPGVFPFDRDPIPPLRAEVTRLGA